MDEQTYLRELAGTYAEIANSAVMEQRREKWRIHNKLEAKTYPFHIEDNGTFFKDIMPPLQCENHEHRFLEGKLVKGITTYNKIDDDRILPNRFVIEWVTTLSDYCDELVFTKTTDRRGGSLGYETNKPLKDIETDFGKLKKRSIVVDREKTIQRCELAGKVFDGLLPVTAGNPGSLYSNGISNKAVHLMGMQELFLQMASNPEAVHRLFSALAEDLTALGNWEEEQGLLTLNNDGNQGYCSGSSQYSDEIPGREIGENERILSTDKYGYLEAQEATGISPDMFEEFFVPHFVKLAKNFKIIKFGCCEPVHNLMPHLKRLHGLRKVSVTPWCDLEKQAENCPPDVIWSRKPVPMKLCAERFDPDDLKAHLQETLTIGKDFFIEFVFRDTCLLTGAMEQRVNQACDIVRTVTGHQEGKK